MWVFSSRFWLQKWVPSVMLGSDSRSRNSRGVCGVGMRRTSVSPLYVCSFPSCTFHVSLCAFGGWPLRTTSPGLSWPLASYWFKSMGNRSWGEKGGKFSFSFSYCFPLLPGAVFLCNHSSHGVSLFPWQPSVGSGHTAPVLCLVVLLGVSSSLIAPNLA